MIKECPLCHSHNLIFFITAKDNIFPSEKNYSALKCLNCKFVFLDNYNEIKDREIYNKEYYKEIKGISKFFEYLFLLERKSIVHKFKENGNLLDIGCGTGKFIELMHQKGWKVTGVEKNHALQLKDNKIKVIEGNFLNINFGSEQFDVITMWQVLEHFNDIHLCMQKISKIMKPDGILIISVPNINSLQFKIGRANWFHLDMPRHKWQFNEHTISYLLNLYGFKKIKSFHFSFEYNIFSWYQTLFNIIGCEPNLIYRFLKRGYINKNYNLQRIYSIFVIILLSIPFLFLSFIMSFFDKILNKGAVITVIASKEKNEKT